MRIDLGEEGKTRLYNYCRQIKEIICSDNIDHLVSGGNSGIAMSEIALMVFDLLDKPRPKLLNVPFFRYLPGMLEIEENRFDYSYYSGQIQAYVATIEKAGKVLFVDDEICQGNTALGIFTLLEQALTEKRLKSIETYYIVAEDQGFNIPTGYDNIIFMPFTKEIAGYNNLIFAFISSEYERPLIKYFGDDEQLAFHLRANLLLNLPVKEYNSGSPVFTDKLLVEANDNVPNFLLLQKAFLEYLRVEISNAIT